MFKTLLFSLVLALSLKADTLSRTQVIMSTFVTISTQQESGKYIEDAFNIIKDVDLSLSSFNSDATIFLLNKNRQVELDNYAYEALKLSEKYYVKTDGYFDITIGSITKDLYRFGNDERLVSSQELANAKVSFNALHVRKKRASLDDGIKIDLGGMGKGFAVDKAAEYFRAKDIKDAIISASGDIRCLSTCEIDIQDPFSDGVLLSFETTKKDLGITTSGNYNRYIESTKSNHLINPKEKKSQTKFVSITLIGSLSSADLDAYATASSVMPMKKSYKFLESLGIGYIVLQSNNKLVISDNISMYTKNLVVNDTVKK